MKQVKFAGLSNNGTDVTSNYQSVQTKNSGAQSEFDQIFRGVNSAIGSGKRIHTDSEVMEKIKQLKESHEKTKKRNK